LVNYEKLVDNELSDFRIEIQKWENMLISNPAMKKRLDAVELEKYLQDVRNIL
jgi:hypothetical protein